MTDKLLLDIGCGQRGPREGYVGVDRHFGLEAYPLAYEDASVDGIVASHILEHFSHKEVDAVLADWVRTLKPGGTLRVAVPDFENIAQEYVKGAVRGVPDEWIVMGAQSDENDYHKSLFDKEHLRQRFANAGLVLLRPWTSDIDDCAAYSFSLNLEGTKPATTEMNVSAVMSVPRLGFQDNHACAFEAFVPLGIKLRRCGGAFWGQALTKAIETTLDEDNVDAVIVLDYDTVFTKANVARLVELLMAHPEADAIAALQSSRHLPTALFTVQDEDGKAIERIPLSNFDSDLQPVATAHFGLTIIRASALRSMPRPWFLHTPDEDGRWGDGKVDEDINFWIKFREDGNTLMLANHVVIGHAELMVRWPGEDLQAIYQEIRDFTRTNTPPEGTWS